MILIIYLMVFIKYDFNRSSNLSNCPRLTFKNKNSMNLTFSISSTLYNVKINNFNIPNNTLLTIIENVIIT